MPEFTEKPATVEARQFGVPGDAPAIVAWMNAHEFTEAQFITGTPTMPAKIEFIGPDETPYTAYLGNWIMFRNGEFTHITDGQFQASYQEL